jgi:3-carboxy-cis,cis-muconate cycloisomerase
MVALGVAKRIPPRISMLLSASQQEHERGLGGWQAELADWCGILQGAHAALGALRTAAEGLHVDAARMRANVDRLRGLACSEEAGALLANVIGRPRALKLMQQLSARVQDGDGHLREVVLEAVRADAQLRGRIGDGDVAAVFDIDRAAAAAIARTDEGLDHLRRLVRIRDAAMV